MALTINGISATIRIDAGVVEAQPPDGPTARVTFQCRYSDRYALLRGLIGNVVISGGGFTRALPYAYPPSPNLFARSILSIKGIKERRDSTGWLTYEKALVEVEFGVLLYAFSTGDPSAGGIDPSGQPWTTTTFSTSFDVIRPQLGTYVFVGGGAGISGEPVEEGAFGQAVPTVAISMTRHWMPYPPLGETLALTGKLNNATVKFANCTFGIGTLLFAGGQSRQISDTLGNTVTDFEYRLLGRVNDWNMVPDVTGTWRLVNTNSAGSGAFPYPYASFAGLP